MESEWEVTAALRTPGPGTSIDSPSGSLDTCPRWSRISLRISTKDFLENSPKCYQIKVVEHKGPLSRTLGIWAIWVSSAQRTVLRGHGGICWRLGWLVSFWLQPIENLAQSVCQTERALTRSDDWKVQTPYQIQAGSGLFMLTWICITAVHQLSPGLLFSFFIFTQAITFILLSW